MVVAVLVEAVKVIHHRFKHLGDLLVGESAEIKVDATTRRAFPGIDHMTEIIHVDQLAHFTGSFHFPQLCGNLDALAVTVDWIIVKLGSERAQRRKNGAADIIRLHSSHKKQLKLQIRQLSACTIGHGETVAGHVGVSVLQRVGGEAACAEYGRLRLENDQFSAIGIHTQCACHSAAAF